LDTVGEPPSAENYALHMPSLKAQEQGESEVATAALSRGNRFANSIRLCIATLCSPHKSKGNKYTYIGYPLLISTCKIPANSL